MKIYTGFITELKDNQVFVFGSNPVGVQGGGAAFAAVKMKACEYDEIMDNCLSKCGKSWGLTTVKYPGGRKTITLSKITENIRKLYKYAKEHKDLEFLVAYTGRGTNLNGYTNFEMANCFVNAGPIPNNFVFEKEFATLLEE
jgi:hypothetical protein